MIVVGNVHHALWTQTHYPVKADKFVPLAVSFIQDKAESCAKAAALTAVRRAV